MFAPSDHPVTTALAVAHGELDDVAEMTLLGLSDAELEAHQVSVRRLVAKLAAHDLAVTAESVARGLDTKAVLVRGTQQDSGTAHRRIRLAQSLSDHRTTRQAMGRGEVSETQADVIVAAVEAIPADLPGIAADVPARAEAALVALAAEHTPRELRVLGRRILDLVAPEVADQVLGESLQREHDLALRTCHLTLTDDQQGRTHLRGHVPASVGAMVRRNLQALMAPRHVRSSGTGEEEEPAILDRPSPERWGRAFCEFVERYPTDPLACSGGVQARAMVTLDHRQLLDALGASTVATIDGVPLPAGEARRLACEAGILPLVLGGASKPLDLGRTRRLHNNDQRLVMERRDRTCTAEGCDTPSWLCHAHHETPWSRGGGTSVETGRLLCPHHHQLAHHPRWETRKSKHGKVVFIRR